MVEKFLSTMAFVPGIAKAYSTIADMLVVSMLWALVYWNISHHLTSNLAELFYH